MWKNNEGKSENANREKRVKCSVVENRYGIWQG
jgi:hypothetical protein